MLMIITFSFELEVSCVSTEDIVASVSSAVSATIYNSLIVSTFNINVDAVYKKVYKT